MQLSWVKNDQDQLLQNQFLKEKRNVILMSKYGS